jgi:hypothetical protein
MGFEAFVADLNPRVGFHGPNDCELVIGGVTVTLIEAPTKSSPAKRAFGETRIRLHCLLNAEGDPKTQWE